MFLTEVNSRIEGVISAFLGASLGATIAVAKLNFIDAIFFVFTFSLLFFIYGAILSKKSDFYKPILYIVYYIIGIFMIFQFGNFWIWDVDWSIQQMNNERTLMILVFIVAQTINFVLVRYE